MKIKESAAKRLFDVFNICFLLLLGVVAFYPLWHVLCASFSDGNELMAHSGALLLPLKPTLIAYQRVFENPMILSGYINTIMILVSGLAVSMVLTCIGAYCLAQKNLYWSGFVMKLFTVTMFFSGGLIPSYILIARTLHLNNSFLALILPGAISTYNLIIMRNAFQQIPSSLTEAAKLEGASEMQTMWNVVVPLSSATMAVIALYYSVGLWNSWFPAAIYMEDREKFPLQLVLREILIENDTTSMMGNTAMGDQYSVGEAIKYSLIVVATLPILLVYPFLQKHFTKGIMIGAVKG